MNNAEKSFKTLATVVNAVKLFFQCNYATISIVSVKIIRKYAASAVNNAEKSFKTLTIVVNVVKLFFNVIMPLLAQSLLKSLENMLLWH